MKVEPPVDRAALADTVRRTHGLEIHTLEFIPAGMVAAYRADGPGGRHFLKLFPLTPTGRLMAERLPAETALLRALRERGALENVPRVVPARDGSSVAAFDGMPFVVQDFIDGATAGERWSDALPALAATLARLHAATARLEGVPFPVPPEDFALPFEAQLLDDLRALERIGPRDRFGPRALRDLLLPRREELLRVLERARAYRALALARPRELVACHTDAHGGNVLLDPHGRLWLLDWETARLAPREHDLWMVHAHLETFLSAYEAALGARPALDADLFAFYFHRRNLEDIAAWMVQVLRDPSSDEQHAHDLEELETYGIGWWPTLEAEVAAVRRALAGRG